MNQNSPKSAIAALKNSYNQTLRLQAELEQLGKIKLVMKNHEAQEALNLAINKIKDELDELSKTYSIKEENLNFIYNDLDANWNEISALNSKNIEYIIDGLVVKNEITMLAAKPASGKSLSALGICAKYLKDHANSKIIYFDFDNSISTLASRNIGALKKEFNERFVLVLGSKFSAQEALLKLQNIAQYDLQDQLFVFDSIKNFIVGDRDKNKDVSELMEVLKSLRNAGATVLFLHHTNKPQKDFSSDFAGAAAFAEDVANAFKLERNADNGAFLFKIIKARTGELKNQAFYYENETHSLTATNYLKASQTKADQEVIEEIMSFLKNSEKPVNFTAIKNFLKENGIIKNPNNASALLKKFDGIYWIREKVAEKNQTFFSLKN